MKFFARECERGEFLLRHDSSFHVGIGVEFGMDRESLLCFRVGNQLDDHLSAHEGNCPPVRRDVAEHPVLDLVPLARTRWVVRDRDGQTRVIDKTL